jgi:hypothetical protein
VNQGPNNRAVLARDAALARLRGATHALVAGSVALAGLFAGLAAASTHPRKVIRRTGMSVAQPQQTIITSTTAATESSHDRASSATTVPPAAPVQTPTTTSSPPVVVSGGS